MENQKSRRNFIKQVALGVTGSVTLQGGMPVNSERDRVRDQSSFGFAAQPVLANVGTNKIEVIVAPNDLATGWVEYGLTKQLGQIAEGSIQGLCQTSDRVLHFQISGLEPGKDYFYRVHLQRVVYHTNWRMEQTIEIQSDIYRFRTLDQNKNTASFVCWNDTHENEETLRRLNGMLSDHQPDFLLWNGDITNNIFREEQIVGQFLNPGGQDYATSTPLMLVRGNHDVRGRDALYLQDYITGPDKQYHFGFRQGPMACLVMDTGEDKPDNHEEYGGLADFKVYRKMQTQWLEHIIREPWFQSAPYRIAFMHIPLIWDRPSRYRDWDGECMGWICEDTYEQWHNLLSKGGIQLVISGHTHRHAYLPPDEERPYGQLVGGGPQPDRATCITGYADNATMTINMTDLDGYILESLSYSAK